MAIGNKMNVKEMKETRERKMKWIKEKGRLSWKQSAWRWAIK